MPLVRASASCPIAPRLPTLQLELDIPLTQFVSPPKHRRCSPRFFASTKRKFSARQIAQRSEYLFRKFNTLFFDFGEAGALDIQGKETDVGLLFQITDKPANIL